MEKFQKICYLNYVRRGIGRDEVLMVPYTSVVVLDKIRPRADPGRDLTRSRGMPFFNELLQTERLRRQTDCITMI